MISRSNLLFLSAISLLPAPSLVDGASRAPVKSHNGMVVSADSMASAAGIDVLRQGGNAVDAAVAVGFVLAVTYPEAGNIGGGGFMVIRMAGGEATMIDFRERAPAAASEEMYLDGRGNPIREKSLTGPLAAGVPGTVSGFMTALNEYGRLGREAVMRRALELAEDGFPVSEHLARILREEMPRFSLFPSTLRAFTRGGEPYRWGDTLRQADLAATLRAIIQRGSEGFYEGDVATRIVAEMKRSGGIISGEDLQDYESVERDPLRGSYRGYEVITAAPPSAGGVTVLQVLNCLERFDLRSMGWNSSRAVHAFAAACQRSFADRAAYLGDPDYVPVPVRMLISKEYAAMRMAGFDSLRALHSPQVGAGGEVAGAAPQTTHYCVADQFGNVVSVTFTLNSLFGCKTVVDGAGFFLNDEMDDFAVKPGAVNLYGLPGGTANAIEPGKRMLSSMAPTILVKGGRPFLVVGARGGSRIPTAVAQVISNVVDFGMNIQEAVDAPRVHEQWIPDSLLYEKRGLEADVLRNLGSMGYVLEEIESSAEAEAMLVDFAAGWKYGGADPREDAFAIGY
ncbi:MAG TPA: gamma-glutamyltransferase [Bacteroidota bacterium]|nr:gamma-glutamyltransferase [Bacteroidota bacterium]